jgi:rubredoxin
MTMDKYKCRACGYVYDPEKGDSKAGVEPGMSFEDLDNKWICPRCHAKKNRFQKYI